jgi:hypothetical protein
MTEIRPPRVAEAILESFGANPEFRDAIIGDLAQEHAQRVERHGARAARFWYHRQALLATPALLRNWLSGAGWADARRLLHVVGLAYVMTLMIEVGIVLVGVAIVEPFGLLKQLDSAPLARWVLGIAVGTFGPTCAGYLAAGLEARRPMVASFALGAVWTGFLVMGAIVSTLFMPHLNGTLMPPVWARFVFIPFIMAACLAGGVLNVRRKRLA